MDAKMRAGIFKIKNEFSGLSFIGVTFSARVLKISVISSPPMYLKMKIG